MVNRAAAAGLITMFEQVAVARPALAKSIVIVLATRCARLVNVTTPLAAIRLVVLCKLPAPALRMAVTSVALSLERRLPNWSSIRITGCCTKANPAGAVEDGCVRTINLVAGPGLTAMVAEVTLLRPPLL